MADGTPLIPVRRGPAGPELYLDGAWRPARVIARWAVAGVRYLRVEYAPLRSVYLRYGEAGFERVEDPPLPTDFRGLPLGVFHVENYEAIVDCPYCRRRGAQTSSGIYWHYLPTAGECSRLGEHFCNRAVGNWRDKPGSSRAGRRRSG